MNKKDHPQPPPEMVRLSSLCPCMAPELTIPKSGLYGGRSLFCTTFSHWFSKVWFIGLRKWYQNISYILCLVSWTYILIICGFRCTLCWFKNNWTLYHFDQGIICVLMYSVESTNHSLWNIFPEMEMHLHKLLPILLVSLVSSSMHLVWKLAGVGTQSMVMHLSTANCHARDEICKFCLISTVPPTELTSHRQLKNSEG